MGDRLKKLQAELSDLEIRRNEILDEIASLNRPNRQLPTIDTTSNPARVNEKSSPGEKIGLFRSLFRGRTDVYPRRFKSRKTGKSGYQPACENEWKPGICEKPRVQCAKCKHRQFLPLADLVIEAHLRGHWPGDRKKEDFTIGVYPMLLDETCWFIAADFDKAEWRSDVSAFRQTCEELNIPVAVECSRSGNGGHVWIFFNEPVPCDVARTMASWLITVTMDRRPEIDFNSYDRLFPNQDTLPKGGFGNLIALPLQQKPRSKGFSVFLDSSLSPYPDQWEFLSSMRRMSCGDVEGWARKALESGQVTGVKMPVTDEDSDRPWEAQPSRKQRRTIVGPFPDSIEIVLANQVFVPKDNLSPSLRNAIVRSAAFQNPDFYQKQAMRMPIWNTPRIISCAENFPEHIALPRGCLEALVELLEENGISVEISDKRFKGSRIKARFLGELYPDQAKASKALLARDTGVLAATTAFGKTVVAMHVLAKRGVNTLILVHRKQLLEQWRARLGEFLDMDPADIGQIGGGKKKPTGVIDVAIIQSLCRKGVVDDHVADYGHIIVDECHHVSAPSFESILREFKGQYVTGLSATVTRKDGHHPIIFMNCGPVRYAVNARKKAIERPFEHRLIIRRTSFYMTNRTPFDDELKITDIYRALIADKKRNDMIIADALEALREGRCPLLLTERRAHLDMLEAMLRDQVEHLIVFKGGMKTKDLKAMAERLESLPEDDPHLILATGRFLGEGFDHPRLDTLFLAMPISWKGTLAQYAGRLHRIHHSKREVIIYDYADLNVRMLSRMFDRRLKGYRSVGYDLDDDSEDLFAGM